MKKSSWIISLLSFVLLCGGIVLTSAVALPPSPPQKKPVQNVSPKRHPNLAAAQKLTAEAYQKIIVAQQANEWDLQGHAQKARELLDQANQELKLAAEASNVNRR